MPKGRIYVVGLGPGSLELLAPAASAAIAVSEVVLGYKAYIELVKPLLAGKDVLVSGMRQELGRAAEAVALAREGKTVAVVSSGDSGIYGMAGPVIETLLSTGWRQGDDPEVEVVPGVPAVAAAAALLGAPLMHDFAVISLSDLMTPWELIVRRLDLAAQADFVLALYNPRSTRRADHLSEALGIVGRHREPETPVGIVRQAFRAEQMASTATLGTVEVDAVDMFSIVIIGNSRTRLDGGLMVTPRGYIEKYGAPEVSAPRGEDR